MYILQTILKQLVDLIINRKLDKDYAKYYPHMSYVNEFLTVKLSTHRQAGHTTAGLMLGQYYKILFIAPLGRRRIISKKLADCENISNTEFSSNVEIMQLYDGAIDIRGCVHSSLAEIIVVDNVSLIKPSILHEIKEGIDLKTAKCLVLLQ